MGSTPNSSQNQDESAETDTNSTTTTQDGDEEHTEVIPELHDDVYKQKRLLLY